VRSRLGRVVRPPFFPYAFSDTGDFIDSSSAAPPTNVDRPGEGGGSFAFG